MKLYGFPVPSILEGMGRNMDLFNAIGPHKYPVSNGEALRNDARMIWQDFNKVYAGVVHEHS